MLCSQMLVVSGEIRAKLSPRRTSLEPFSRSLNHAFMTQTREGGENEASSSSSSSKTKTHC